MSLNEVESLVLDVCTYH